MSTRAPDPVEVGHPQASYSYKAFISYSHAADGKLAPALQAGLHAFARPWYRLRAMRVFRDATVLSPGLELWDAIEAALQESEYFLFLASPKAVASRYVCDELDYWMGKRSKERMLIVLTDGDIVWDRDAGDFDWERTTAIPRSPEKRFPGEPLYLDLRWARNQEHLSLRNPSFRSAIADLASTLLQRPKDELIGEDVRRHRQTRRVAAGAIAALVALTVSSVVAAFLAVRNQRIAEDRQHLAQSRQLAAQARNELQAGQLDLALLLGLESFRPLDAVKARDPAQPFDARNALLESLQANPRLERYLFRAGAESLGDARFTPDGKLIAIATHRQITFWDPSTGKQSGTALDGPQEAVFRIAFNPAGDVLAVASRGEQPLTVFDVSRREPLYPPLTAQDGAISGLAFSPDGRLLASGAGDHSIVLWDVASGEPDGDPLVGHSSNVVALDFSPDGHLLASASWDGTAVIWDLSTRTARLPPIEHGGQVEDLAFSPDGTLLATVSGDTVAFWDPLTGERSGNAVVHGAKVDTVAFSPDGVILAVGGSGNEEITLWSVRERTQIGVALRGHTSWIESLSFSPDGQTLASTSADGSVIVWRPARTQRLAHATTVGSGVTSFAASPDGALLAVGTCSGDSDPCESGDVQLWRVTSATDSGEPALEPLGTPFRGHAGAVQTVTFGAGEGELITGSCAGFESSRCVGAEIRRWNASAGTSADSAALLAGVRIDGMTLGPEGRLLAAAVPVETGGDGYELWVVNTETGTPVGEPLVGIDRVVLDIVFDASGQRVAATSLDDTALVWNTSTGFQAFEPIAGSRLVASAIDGTIVTLYRDGSSTYAANRVVVWDGASGEKVRESVTATRGIPLSVALAAQRRVLAFGDADGAIVLWDLYADRMLGVPSVGHDGGVRELAFAANERALVSADEGGRLVVWDLDESSWKSRACRIANRNLSYGEWVQYFGDEPYRVTCPEHGVPASLAAAGRERASLGDVEGATALLARAAELGDRSVENAASEAAAIAAQGLVEKATRLASSGNVAAAEATFARARELAPEQVRDPAGEARTLAAANLAARGERLARLGRLQEALEAYARALDLDAAAVAAEQWSSLCVAGIFEGRASDVLSACDRAVAGAEESENFFDSRGIARALTGDTAGAVADFESFAARDRMPGHRAGHPGSMQERAQLDYIARVEGWAADLRASVDPFSAEELEELRSTRFAP